MHPEALRGGRLSAYSAHSCTFSVDLERWGGPEGSTTAARCNSGIVDLVQTRLRDPASPKAASAVKDLTDHLGKVGFVRAWYGLPKEGHPAQAAMESIGFRICGVYSGFRLRLEPGGPAPARGGAGELAVRPWDESDEQLLRFFDESASGNPAIQVNSEPRFMKNIILHERVMHADRYSSLRYGTELVGGMDYHEADDPAQGRYAHLVLFLGSDSWKSGRAAEILGDVIAFARGRGVRELGAHAEASQEERLRLFEGAGFSSAHRYAHMVRPLRA
jgi:RimJ/RimL family protein N-acetyltransferase